MTMYLCDTARGWMAGVDFETSHDVNNTTILTYPVFDSRMNAHRFSWMLYVGWYLETATTFRPGMFKIGKCTGDLVETGSSSHWTTSPTGIIVYFWVERTAKQTRVYLCSRTTNTTAGIFTMVRRPINTESPTKTHAQIRQTQAVLQPTQFWIFRRTNLTPQANHTCGCSSYVIDPSRTTSYFGSRSIYISSDDKPINAISFPRSTTPSLFRVRHWRLHKARAQFHNGFHIGKDKDGFSLFISAISSIGNHCCPVSVFAQWKLKS